MGIRLKITGGFGGPASWQDLSLDADTVGKEKLAEIEASLKAAVQSQQPAAPGQEFFADGQTYAFEFESENEQNGMSVTDANITDEIREIVQLIRENAKKNCHAEKED